MDTTVVPTDSRAGSFLLSTFILLGIAWIVYFCRIYTRIYIVRGIFPEDYFITIGMTSLTIFAAMVPVQTSHGGGAHFLNIPNPEYNIPRWGHAFFIAQQMYVVTLFGVKMSIAFLLLRFSASKALDWTLYGVAGVTTGLTIAFTLWLTFQCSPVAAQWDTSIEGVCVSRDAYVDSVYILSAFSAATDIITAIAPIFVLRNLTLDQKSKWSAAITMGLGSVACIATIVRFKFIRDFSISTDVTYAMVHLSIASFVEVALGCICASLATLRPFLQGFLVRNQRGELLGEEEAEPPGIEVSACYDEAHKSWDTQETVEEDELIPATRKYSGV
ncbi:uncharacterized protein RCC_08925 [Ramularia collo-cygni]|uniref:Rhodopsin domain-containing protein n=1 Tax=Ramularia collo-cygni TaxID=112498 RepID=A0A2D3VL55_9PEZI|nr:uncharacterized protein RCC_08925 [Ramularia collo-cygni]CZT23214.1 uncharacterized protein RCC_08925 [Ramularia collo-cygni]